mgnify:CR=1 FL=1
MKKLLGIVVLGLLLSGNAYAELTNLVCKFTNIDRSFGLSLDFQKSLWIDEHRNKHHMKHNENLIQTSTPGGTVSSELNWTHTYWRLSRLTGSGYVEAHKISDDELKPIKDSYLREILIKKLGNLEDESLTPKRNKIINEHLVEFLDKRNGAINKMNFDCEKSKHKF